MSLCIVTSCVMSMLLSFVGTSQPNVTATPAAQDSDGVVLVGAGSALIGVICGILLACFVAILTACCCRLKKKKKTLNFNNQE